MSEDNPTIDINVIGPDPEGVEGEDWVVIELDDGTREEYLIDDVFDVEYNGINADYAVMVPRPEVEKAEADPAYAVDNILIAKMAPPNDPDKPSERDLLPVEDEDEYNFVIAAIAEAYGEEVDEADEDEEGGDTPPAEEPPAV